MADEVYTESNGSEDRDEDEQAPSGAEAVFADEYLVESRLRGCDWFGQCKTCVTIGVLVVDLTIQAGVLEWRQYIRRVTRICSGAVGIQHSRECGNVWRARNYGAGLQSS